MSHPLVVPILICMALLLSTGWFWEDTKKKERPPARSAEIKAAQEKRVSDEKINAEKRALSSWMRANTGGPVVPSAAAAVVWNGRPVAIETVNCTPSTLFQAASLTKTFTALAILQLADRGILSLDDPISTHLGVPFEAPGLNSDRITVWHLLTHTSGLIEDPTRSRNGAIIPSSCPSRNIRPGSGSTTATRATTSWASSCSKRQACPWAST